MKLNQAGIDLIKHFEGCKLTAYRDIVDILTIGYGSTTNVKSGMKITQARAEQLLQQDLQRFCKGVTDLVEADINDNQYSALVSFSYNLGLHSLERSTLLKRVNSEDYEIAADEFLKWANAGGELDPGLYKRRQAERALFLSTENLES